MINITFLLPIQSPYYSRRLERLALYEDLEIILLVERSTFNHRPGWKQEPINGVTVEVLGSQVITSVNKGDDLGYRIQGIRPIPWKLSFVLWRFRPDIIVLCNATQLLLALPFKWLVGGCFVLVVEDTPHSTRNLSSLRLWVKKWIYRRADRFIAFSEDARSFLNKIGIQQDVHRSSWSLDMMEFQPNKEENNYIKYQNLNKIDRIVIFVGAFIINKGVLLLLEAWNKLPLIVKEHSKLLMVGSGPVRTEMENYIQKNKLTNVEIVGQLTYMQVRDLLCSSDLLVLPTLQDLFSLTVLEAMACGCPVITTPYNGARELVDEGQNGWLVDPTKPGTLTSVLENALSDQTDLREMGRKARKRVEQMDNSIVMNEFAQMLRSFVSD